MTNRRRGVALTPMETRRDVILKAALLAEELGYEVFSVAGRLGMGFDPDPDRARATYAAHTSCVWRVVSLGT